MKLVPEELYLACLEALESSDSVEQILARYPDYVDELRPFLATALVISHLASQPAAAARETSRQRFLQTAAELRKPAKPRSAWYRLRPILAPVALLIMLLLVGASTITASNAALPGDALYETKRLFESFRLTQTGSGEMLRRQTQIERLREVEAVLQLDREVTVEFEGTIESMQADGWLVSGIAVRVDRFTRIKGDPQLGASVLVNGRIYEGVLRVLYATVLTAGHSSTTTPTAPAAVETALPSPPNSAEPPAVTTTPTINDNHEDDGANDDDGDDGVGENGSDNSGDGESADENDDDHGNDNRGEDDNANDNEGDDNSSSGADDNANDDNGGDSGNNSGSGNANDNEGDDNDNDINHGSGSGNLESGSDDNE